MSVEEIWCRALFGAWRRRISIILDFAVVCGALYDGVSGGGASNWHENAGEMMGSNLLQSARQFWYNNEPGTFKINGYEISRQQIHTYGGPAPEFNDCPTCQKLEWLSRIQQKNLFESHSCKMAGKCKAYCSRQGNELWTTYHQNFWFMVGCDKALNAPRCLIVFHPHRKVRLWKRFWTPYCDFLFMNFRRLVAQTCQVEVVQSGEGVDWSKYDFVIYQNLGDGYVFPKPPIPMVMIMYDLWIRDYQSIIDYFQPEYLLTPYPGPLRNNFKFKGKIHFYPLHDSCFFSRPNVTGAKRVDLLLIGADKGIMYGPRRELDKQARHMKRDFLIEESHHLGSKRHRHTGLVQQEGGKPVYYLNKWSEHLGSSKFVAFAGFSDERYQPLFAKYYEVFGSGAVPIVPRIPDLELLNVRPMAHYIPLHVVWENPGKWRYVLKNHKKYRRIAENAVRWHRENEKRLLFDQFENLVQEVTANRYPRRAF